MSSYLFKPPAVKTVPILDSEKLFPVNHVFCVGRNYADHAKEMGVEPEQELPTFFMKPASAVVACPQEINYPSATQKFHHEVELVIALKKGGKNLEKEAALSCIYGFATGLDLTRRDLQKIAKDKRLPWDSAKAFEQSAPCGAITTMAEEQLPADTRINLKVNGEIRQEDRVRNMIWSMKEIIAHLSRLFELQAGDLIFTGTPAGVDCLHVGDQVVAAIDGLDGLNFKII